MTGFQASIAALVLGSLAFVCPRETLRVVSPNGRFAAEATARTDGTGKARDDGVVPCDLAVYEVRAGGERVLQWRGLYDYRGGAEGHFLTDDGSAFAHVDGRYSEVLPLVRVIRKGLVLAALDARALAVADPRASTPASAWIDVVPECCRLRDTVSVTSTVRALDLFGRDGVLRTIDLASGALEIRGGFSLALAPSIERRIGASEAAGLESPFVKSASASPMVVGDAIAIEIVGSYPTPGWELAGFALDVDAADPQHVTIRPLAKPPNGIVAQVLRPLRATTKIGGLKPGSYAISVRGREPAQVLDDVRVDVVPDGLLVMSRVLADRGGRSVMLLADGRCLVTSGPRSAPQLSLAPVPLVDEIRQRIAQLDPKLASDASAPDRGEVRELVWNDGAKIVRALRAADALEPPLAAIAASLDVLARPHPVRHVVDASASVIAVHTSSAGLLSAFGHDHTLAAKNAIEGYVDVVPDALEKTVLELSLRADALAVADEPSQKDRPEIEKEMREHVLETARYPMIRFKSQSVSAVRYGARTYDVEIRGELELHGVAREITIRGRVGIDEIEVQARGTFELKQSDFGIRPTSAVGGTVKVDDQLKLEFDVRARRSR